MNHSQKVEIKEAALSYMRDNNLSQGKLATQADISTAYMSKICSGVFEFANNGRKASPISDQVFYKLADAIGHKLEFVPHFNSDSYQRIMNACAFAQNNHRRFLIDSKDSGLCKTYTLEHYAQTHKNVLYVKCTSLMKGKDLIQLLIEKLRLSFDGRVSNSEKLAAITKEMISRPGFLIILDEFENVAPDMYRVLKDIEDATYTFCALVLCGMGIIKELENAAKRQKKLGPQLWRRFRTNKLMLGMYRKEFTMNACAEHDITDGKVVKWLMDRVTDFGMLAEYVKDIHTYLTAQGKPVNIEEVERLFQPL